MAKNGKNMSKYGKMEKYDKYGKIIAKNMTKYRKNFAKMAKIWHKMAKMWLTEKILWTWNSYKKKNKWYHFFKRFCKPPWIIYFAVYDQKIINVNNVFLGWDVKRDFNCSRRVLAKVFTNEDIHYNLKAQYGDSIECFYSDYNTNSKIIFRIRVSTKNLFKKKDVFLEEDYIHYVKTYLDKLLNESVIRGTKNIENSKFWIKLQSDHIFIIYSGIQTSSYKSNFRGLSQKWHFWLIFHIIYRKSSAGLPWLILVLISTV